MPPPKKGMTGLALVFGAKGGGKKPSSSSEDMGETLESEESEGDLPEDFEDYIVQAFPDLEGSPERQMAMWKAVKACMKAKEY